MKKTEQKKEKRKRDFGIKKEICRFIFEEEAVGIVEIILILVILIALVLLFKTKITQITTKAFKSITDDSGDILG